MKGGVRKTVGGGAGKVFFCWSLDDGTTGEVAGGGATEGSGDTEGSGATKAGFRRSMEMTYGWPCLEMVNVLSPLF